MNQDVTHGVARHQRRPEPDFHNRIKSILKDTTGTHQTVRPPERDRKEPPISRSGMFEEDGILPCRFHPVDFPVVAHGSSS
jgi:hypothetical protein